MDDWKTDDVVNLMMAAAAISLGHFHDPRCRRKPDGTVVTPADLEIERFLARHLDRPAQGRFLLGEESAGRWGHDPAQFRRAMEQSLYIVDPIDGTAPFASRLPTWGISLGLARAGRLQEGAICLPATGEMFVSQGPAVWHLQLAEGRVTARTRMTPPKRRFHQLGMVAVTQEIVKHGRIRLANPIQALGSAVVAMAYVLQGHYLAYVGQLKVWDLAGGLPLLLKLGLHATLSDGRRLTEEVSDEFYYLRPADPHRWLMRQPAVFGVAGAARRVLPTIERGAP